MEDNKIIVDGDYSLPNEDVLYKIGSDGALVESTEVQDQNGLTHMDKIRIAANASEITIKDPKENCSKCNGRGYTGFRSIRQEQRNGQKPIYEPFGTGQPIVCTCIFVKDEKSTVGEQREALTGGFIQPTLNRAQRRKMDRMAKKFK